MLALVYLGQPWRRKSLHYARRSGLYLSSLSVCPLTFSEQRWFVARRARRFTSSGFSTPKRLSGESTQKKRQKPCASERTRRRPTLAETAGAASGGGGHSGHPSLQNAPRYTGAMTRVKTPTRLSGSSGKGFSEKPGALRGRLPRGLRRQGHLHPITHDRVVVTLRVEEGSPALIHSWRLAQNPSGRLRGRLA